MRLLPEGQLYTRRRLHIKCKGSLDLDNYLKRVELGGRWMSQHTPLPIARGYGSDSSTALVTLIAFVA